MSITITNITQPTTEQSTNNLRFYDEVLQQKYEIITYKHGLAHKVVYEWRDVEKITSKPTSKS